MKSNAELLARQGQSRLTVHPSRRRSQRGIAHTEVRCDQARNKRAICAGRICTSVPHTWSPRIAWGRSGYRQDRRHAFFACFAGDPAVLVIRGWSWHVLTRSLFRLGKPSTSSRASEGMKQRNIILSSDSAIVRPQSLPGMPSCLPVYRAGIREALQQLARYPR